MTGHRATLIVGQKFSSPLKATFKEENGVTQETTFNHLRSQLARELLAMGSQIMEAADLCGRSISQEAVSEAMNLLRKALPRLDEIRAQIATGRWE